MKQHSLFCLYALVVLICMCQYCSKAVATAQLASGKDDNAMQTVAPLRNLPNSSVDPAPVAPSSGSDSQSADSAVSPSNPQSDNATGTGVSSAPGADAMMTRDLLLVAPNKSGQPPKPLQDFIGSSLTLKLGRTDIILDGLRGLFITVTNDTSRPLLIDGHSAVAISGANHYTAAPVSLVQKSVMPSNSAVARVCRLLTNSSLGLLSVGAIPTVKDYMTMRKPISKRYGPDERRRIVEASRFGKRILWPHDKTQGIVYFQTHDNFADIKLQIPVNTLFDNPDSALLTSDSKH
jgi:hypothetical protein